MSKPRLYGMPGSYTPNSKMDMRHKKKLYQRQRELAERAEDHAVEARERREKIMLEEMKYGNHQNP